MRTYRPNHVGISVRNLEKSLAFYKAFGFTEINRTIFDVGATLVHLQLGEFAIELFEYEKNRDVAEMQFGFANDLDIIGIKHFALATDDIHAALADLREKGIADETVEVGGLPSGLAQWIFIKDPDGTYVEVIQEDRFSIYDKAWPKALAKEAK